MSTDKERNEEKYISFARCQIPISKIREVELTVECLEREIIRSYDVINATQFVRLETPNFKYYVSIIVAADSRVYEECVFNLEDAYMVYFKLLEHFSGALCF